MIRAIERGDRALIQIVDAAFASSARRSGEWLVCHPGCTQCCFGSFAINQLDAHRLRRGLAALQSANPDRGARVLARAGDAVRRLSPDFPGDPVTGILDPSEAGQKKFAAFANHEPCPVLDPQTGLCDLYDARPMTCRTFGPPVRTEGGLAVCELCYRERSNQEIAACEMIPDPDDLESQLLNRLEQASGTCGETIVAFALAPPARPAKQTARRKPRRSA